MINIKEAKRLIKRAILANLVTEKKNLAITPLVSGKHGIGKSAMIKSIAEDLGGVCITIEGGTLKEGEITGLPYQYTDEKGDTYFRFLPYYAVDRIQKEEKRMFALSGLLTPEENALLGSENRYAQNQLSPKEKIEAIRSGQVQPVLIFIDEINRTENNVYKELMNILLTRSVNGYQFPWWVFFVGAMNPSTLNSVYATNEMDPAQLDRFLKIKVTDDTQDWLNYAEQNGISENIQDFIRNNPKCLSTNERELLDEEKPLPSPRGWEMIDILLQSEPALRVFFSEQENSPKIVEKDMKNLVSAKLGSSVATMFFASLVTQSKAINPEDLFADDEKLSNTSVQLEKMSPAKRIQTCDRMLEYLKENIEFLMLDAKGFQIKKQQLSNFIKKLDSSTKLLFAQNLASAQSFDGNNLLDLLFDVFEKDLIEMLDFSDANRKNVLGKR